MSKLKEKSKSFLKKSNPADAFMNDLVQAIEGGELKPGDKILSVREICRHYGLQIGSVQNVLTKLEKSGYVYPKHGNGVFVAQKEKKQELKISCSSDSALFPYLQAVVKNCKQSISFTNELQDADIFCGNYFMQNIFLPLNKWLDKDKSFDLNDWLPNVLDKYISGTRIYGIPVYASPLMLYYNADLFRLAKLDVPDQNWTWKEMINAISRLESFCDSSTGAMDLLPGYTHYMPFFAQNGCRLFSRKNECNLHKKDVIKVVLSLRDLFKAAGWIPEYDYQKVQENFLQGKTAMTISGGFLNYKLFKEEPFAWNSTLLPGGRERSNIYYSEALHIMADSKNQDQSWEFIKEAVSLQSQEFFTNNHFPFPARKKPAENFVKQHGSGFQCVLDDFSSLTEDYISFLQLNEMDEIFAPGLSPETVSEKCTKASEVINNLLNVKANKVILEKSLV
jgi:DNA-binding transcriptional regulator YhcF (GntR family)